MFELFRTETETERITKILKKGAWLQDKEFYEMEIRKWKVSREREMQITGINYYKGLHDILNRQRTAIGRDGELEVITNLPNNRIVDNQYAKAVRQKANYLVGKPITVTTENPKYYKELTTFFNAQFRRLLKKVCKDALNCGIAYIYPYYNEIGELKLKRFDPYEILPFWKDTDHTELDCFARVYKTIVYENRNEKRIERVELYFKDRIERYFLTSDDKLIPEPDNFISSYIVLEDEAGEQHGYNWGKVPLIPFKYLDDEIPLINRVKSLQDAINVITSDFTNNMEEDTRNTILVIKNYDGANLAELRRNLAVYGAVKVRTTDGVGGDVSTLRIEVNAENYEKVLEVLKKALIENAMGFDVKDIRVGGNPNQLNIQSMFADIELDADDTETEFQASLESLLFFFNMYLATQGIGNFDEEKVDIIFNRDMLMNESEIIANCKNSIGILSMETIIEQHPWIKDVEKELERKKKEQENTIDDYEMAFAKGDINEE